jgi:hypothetical protein
MPPARATLQVALFVTHHTRIPKGRRTLIANEALPVHVICKKRLIQEWNWALTGWAQRGTVQLGRRQVVKQIQLRNLSTGGEQSLLGRNRLAQVGHGRGHVDIDHATLGFR